MKVPGVRPVPLREAVRVARLGGLLCLGSALATTPLLSSTLPLANRAGQATVTATSAVAGLALLLSTLHPPVVAKLYRFNVHLYLLLGTAFTSFGLLFVGPRYEIGAVLYVEVAIFAFYLLRRPWATAHLAVIGTSYALVLADWGTTGGDWFKLLFLMIGLSVIGAAVGLSMERADVVAGQLAELNISLEARVADQVSELARLGRLRRFLSPQVADAVLGTENALAPHRRQIAVFFCDLRGFTRFANDAEPEEVVEALGAYYGVLGEHVRAFDATVGTFAGDGLMAYFNDPVPCDDPAGRALDLALAVRDPLDALVDRWARKGFRLGYGIGVAYGYATLGTIGFEGRYDYTALGACVNLAARLCAEAAPGEVLLDERTYDAVADRVKAERCAVRVKGFREPVAAFRVLP